MRIITDLTPTADNQDIIYNSLDTMQTMALQEVYDAGLMPDYAKYTYAYSEKMLGPIMTMMRRGTRINTATRDRIVAGLRDRMAVVRANFDTLCESCFGTDFNINSDKQMKALFYEFVGIPEQTRSKKGETKVSTDKDTLEKIAKSYPRGAPFALHVLRLRDLDKQIEFLTKSLTADNRFVTSYNIAGTETFRLSSSEHPLRLGSNQQNIPAIARQAFEADPGYLFFQADQQGAEARIVAYLSGDENYIKACEGGDSHTMVASMVFGFEPIRELAEREYRRGKSYRQACKSGAHGCLTADHEVLTPSGWQPISDMPACIAQWSPVDGGTIDWAEPSNWLHKTTNNLVSIEGASISSLSTPDHKFVVWVDGQWRERTAETLKKSDGIPYTGRYVAGKQTVRYARLVAAYQADGNFSGDKCIRFKFRRPRKIARMRELLSKASVGYSENSQGLDTIFLLKAEPSREIAAWGKHASAELLKWDQDSLSDYVEESIYWDGTRGPSGRQAVCSVNLEHCRWLQTIFQMCGWGSKVIDNTGKQRANAFGKQRPHWVSKNCRRYAAVSKCIRTNIDAADTDVYCPTVPTGYFLVRRKGHVYVTGNSNYMGKPFTLAQQMGVETEVAEQFQAAYFKKFPGIPAWHAHIAKQLQTKGYIDNVFGMRRPFWARKWDDATLREAVAFGPQSAVGVLTNIVLYVLWLKYEGQPGAPVQILMNGHDAAIGQIREDLADELIPQLLEDMKFPFEVTDIHGNVRTCVIPFDMEVGRNWGKHSPDNPEGLQKWKPKT